MSSRRALLRIVAGILLSTIVAQVQSQHPSANQTVSQVAPAIPVSISIKQADALTLGEQMFLEVFFKNIGNTSFSYAAGSAFSSMGLFDVRLIDFKGRDVPRKSTDGIMMMAMGLITVKPGESSHQPLPLDDLFSITTPGEYEVIVFLKSNPNIQAKCRIEIRSQVKKK